MFRNLEVVFGMILLAHFVDSDDRCKSIDFGMRTSQVKDKLVKSYDARDEIDIRFEAECDGDLVGLEATACYSDNFTMIVDEDLSRMYVVREDSLSPVEIWIYAKFYCYGEVTDPPLVENTVDEAYGSENPIQSVSAAQTRVWRGVDKTQKGVDKAQKVIQKAQVSVETAQKKVEESQRIINDAQLALDKVQENVENAYRVVITAQAGVEKAQRKVEKAQKRADKSQVGIDNVLRNMEPYELNQD